MVLIVTALLGATLAAAIANNWQRQKSQIKFTLMPNCLMTNSPLVFVTGLRSPFYFLNYWNHIPYYLREHGYEVVEVDLPWRDQNLRRQDLAMFLEAAHHESLKFHFIFDATSVHEVNWLRQCNHPAVQSIQCIDLKSLGLENALLRLHRRPLQRLATFLHSLYLPKDAAHAFCPAAAGLGSRAPELVVEKEFLRLAISLAEKELKLAHTGRELPVEGP